MKIEDLPLNDTFVQYMRSLRLSVNEEAREKVIKRMKKCNHLFVKLKEGQTIPGFHSTEYYYDPCVVECVHCGLTNKFCSLENSLTSRYVMGMKKISLHTKVFNKVYKSAYTRGGKGFDESVFNLISNESIDTSHPKLLFEIANKISPFASNSEIFEIMKVLNFIETNQEKLRLNNKEQAEDLINRYYTDQYYKINNPNLVLKR